MIPILALVGFGFTSLRWERQSQEEEMRSRCLSLSEPLRSEFFNRISKHDQLQESFLAGSIDTPPQPAGESDSLMKYLEGQYQAVLGEAGALSETGLPLRPLAAIRLIRSEDDPVRLNELVGVIINEPGFLTKPLLREAEKRFRELELSLPSRLEGWEIRMERTSIVQSILGGKEPRDLLSSSPIHWIGQGEESMLLIKSPDGPVLVDRESLQEVISASRHSISDALPDGISATIGLDPQDSNQAREIVSDSGIPSVRFIVADEMAFDQLFNRRRGFFAGFLSIAALLSITGVVVLLRSVARERELAERKGNLIAAVSHEMRTPVASIRLLAENLASGAANTKERRAGHHDQLLEQSKRLSSLVENVLSYSKRNAGRANWRFEPLDLEDLFKNAATQFKPLAESREISLKYSLGELEEKPFGDITALRQALNNLLDNALKHSAENSEIRFGAQCHGDDWCLWVSDDGPGVPLEEQKKIFDAFYRVGSELRRETKGTGLGLALVQQVARGHGGQAVCFTSKTDGARFELHLPYSPRPI